MIRHLRLCAALVLLGACADHPTPEPPTATPDPAPTAGSLALRPIMVQLGEDVGALSNALWLGDLEAVAEAARAVAEHPRVSAEERQRIQAALGGDFAAFAAGDHRVHETALRLREAALRADTTGVLLELGELQAGCVACHAAFRDRLLTRP